MAHTPGPYEIRHEFNIFSGKRLIASTGGFSDVLHDEEVHNENMDNARFIAVACNSHDALFSACSEALAELTWLFRQAEDGTNAAGPSEAIMAKLEAAITNAKVEDHQ